MEFWEEKNDEMDRRLCCNSRPRKAFTLIELLVVIAVITLLLAILTPTLSLVKKKAATIQGIVNQRSVATSLNLFANDNSDRYPHSIATAGMGGNWNWTDPRLMTGYPSSYDPRMSAGGFRSMSGYLDDYVDNPEILHCTNSPDDYKFLRESWEAGDQWDNPDRLEDREPMTGSYCFWWGYRGWLTDKNKVFTGPVRSSGGAGQSRMLLSDYFGSDTWRNWGQYGSCEKFKGARVVGENSLFTDFYSGGDITQAPPMIKLNAAFTDGHIEAYDSTDVVTLEVSKRWDGKAPFPQAVGKGKFYIPRAAMP